MGSQAGDVNFAFTGLTAGRIRNTPPMKPMPRRGGFTLIEILIVVAVIGILAAIAYPAYQDQVRKSRRGQAKADLTELAQFMERNFTEANRYDETSGGVAIDDEDDLPFKTSPRDAAPGTQFYDIGFPAAVAPATNPAQSTFTLEAAPVNAQAGDPCGTYTLTHTGDRDVTGGTLTVANCW